MSPNGCRMIPPPMPSPSFVSIALHAILLALSSTAFAADLLPPTVSAALRRAAIPETAVAIYVQQVGNRVPRDVGDANLRPPGSTDAERYVGTRAGQPPLLVMQGDRAMNPASTMKLVTTYAALELLGPAYTWKTVVASNATVVGDTLEGDLVVRGGGDPKFVVESLWLMLRQLRGRGIRTIHGDVLVDRGAFELAPYDPGAFDREPYRPYNVGPDALLVNFKSVTLRFIPDDAKREVRIAVEPVLADFVVGPVVYADGPCGDWKARAAADFSRPEGLTFAGAYAGSCGEQTWNVAVLDHARYFSGLFRSLWADVGGTLTGTVRDGRQPADARVLVERESPSVAEVIRDINKYSNNVMARELFLSLGADGSKGPATVERAQRAVRAFYATKGNAMTDLVIDNGSGLSRQERISANSMAAVLQSAWSSPVMPEFVASLPLVGFDGTMRQRLTTKSVAGQAHIKTGTLADAKAVAGYVLASSGRRYVVVFFVNTPGAQAAQAAQDALLQWVYDNG